LNTSLQTDLHEQHGISNMSAADLLVPETDDEPQVAGDYTPVLGTAGELASSQRAYDELLTGVLVILNNRHLSDAEKVERLNDFTENDGTVAQSAVDDDVIPDDIIDSDDEDNNDEDESANDDGDEDDDDEEGKARETESDVEDSNADEGDTDGEDDGDGDAFNAKPLPSPEIRNQPVTLQEIRMAEHSVFRVNVSQWKCNVCGTVLANGSIYNHVKSKKHRLNSAN
jgi:hypothetical protein